MNYELRSLIRQAQALTPTPPDPTGLRHDVLALSCKFHIKGRCNHGNGNLIWDPSGKVHIAAPACNPCKDYINAAFDKDEHSAEAHECIEVAIGRTWDALFVTKVIAKVVG